MPLVAFDRKGFACPSLAISKYRAIDPREASSDEILGNIIDETRWLPESALSHPQSIRIRDLPAAGVYRLFCNLTVEALRQTEHHHHELGHVQP